MEPADAVAREKISKALSSLLSLDIARVSNDQLEVLRRLIRATKVPPHGQGVRVALLHHQILPIGVREEFKSFESVSNLGHLREFLRLQKFDLVFHGHKHNEAAIYDHIYDEEGTGGRRVLVVSGGTFDDHASRDALRTVQLDGAPWAPEVTIQPWDAPKGGLDIKPGRTVRRQLWPADEPPEHSPAVIYSRDIDTAYVRARALANRKSRPDVLIVHLDLDHTAPFAAPFEYPSDDPDALSKTQRLVDLAAWWQSKNSRLGTRSRFVHGIRLSQYAGTIDQIARIKRLLTNSTTTRAIATLIDPVRDFTLSGSDEAFPSFALLQFSRRDGGAFPKIDCIAYYRAQEFGRWWPVNIAEIRQMQLDVAAAVGAKPGRITTISADPRVRSRSPTEVSVPLTDRWIDQQPSKLYKLAFSLVFPEQKDTDTVGVKEAWLASLSEQIKTTDEYDPDGTPVAIESMELLSELLFQSNDDALREMSKTLLDLADHNRQFEAQKPNQFLFSAWSKRARELLIDLQGRSQERWQARG